MVVGLAVNKGEVGFAGVFFPLSSTTWRRARCPTFMYDLPWQYVLWSLLMDVFWCLGFASFWFIPIIFDKILVPFGLLPSGIVK